MSRPVARWVVLPLLAAVLAAAGALAWHLRVRRERYFTDGNAIRQPVETAATRPILWGPPEAVAGAGINTAGDERDPASTEGAAFYFVRGRAGHDADIWVCERGAEGFAPPRPLAEINTGYDELGPALAPDGSALYFHSDRPGGLGLYDLWVSRRREGAFGPPENLGPAVNSRYNDHSPSIAAGGRTLYFASDRPDTGASGSPPSEAWSSQIAGETPELDDDLYAADLGGAGPAPAAPLAEVNTVHDETTPAASPAGDFVYFASDRPGGEGGFDLYRTRFEHGAHTPPEHLGRAANSPADELDPAVGLGGFGIHFASDRPREHTAGGSAGDFDLYWMASREVVARTETYRASIDAAALWAALWPFLLLGLLASLALVGLLAALRHVRSRRLSLLVRCMMGSLAAHVVLLFLFGFWAVSTSAAIWTRPPGGLRVALVSPAVGSGIAVQIRGAIASSETTVPPVEAAGRDGFDATPSEPRLVLPELRAGTVEAPPADPQEVTAPEAAPPEREALPAAEAALDDAAGTLLVELPAAAPRAQQAEESVDLQVARGSRLSPLAEAGDVAPAPASGPPSIRVAPPALGPVSADPLVSRTAADASSPAQRLVVEPAPAAGEVLADLPEPSLPDLPRDRVLAAGPVEQDVAAFAGPVAAEKDAGLSVPAAGPQARPGAVLSPSRAAAGDEAPLPLPAGLPEATGARTAAPRVPGPSAARVALPDLELPGLPELPEYQRTAYRGTAVATPGPRADASRDRVSVAAAAAPAPQAPALPPGPAPEDPPASLVAPNSSDAAPRAPDAAPPPAGAVPGGALARVPPLALPPLLVSPAAAVDEAELEVNGAAAGSSRPGWQLPGALRREAPHVLSDPARVAPVPAQPVTHSADAPPRPGGEASLDRLLEPARPLELAETALDVKLPQRTVENPFPFRAPQQRQDLLEKMGGDETTEQAVALALGWLARHQSEDGRWDSQRYDAACGHCPGSLKSDADIAITGLALLCFLAADHAPDRAGPYREHVSRGLEWLLGVQRPGGALLGDESMYSHGIATIALAEALGMTGGEKYRRPVERAVEFIYGAHSAEQGGWRYGPRQAGDTSVTGWQIMALASGRRAGVDVPEAAFDVGRDWMRRVVVPGRLGQYAYQPGMEPRLAMTAEGMFTWQLLGVSRHDPRMRESARHLARHLPQWDGNPNSYYWYYATMALFQHQGPEWAAWNDQMKAQLVEHQVAEGPAAGSWPTVELDPWATVGGRVYQTAICTLTLEVYYRYLPGFVQEPED